MVNMVNVKKMRIKQVIATNILVMTAFSLYFSVIKFFNISNTLLFFALAVILLCQAVIALVKKSPTNSFIPIFKQVEFMNRKRWETSGKNNKSQLLYRVSY